MFSITDEAVEADLQRMAATCSVDMVLWDRFSNGVLYLLSTLQSKDREIARLREALLHIAETDWHTRQIKPNPDGGMRGYPGLYAVRALTGLHGSCTSDAKVRELEATRQALSTTQDEGKQEVSPASADLSSAKRADHDGERSDGRRDYRLSDGDFDRLLKASQPVAYLIANGTEPESPREAAMRIWREIADREGVDVDSIRQGSDGNGHFTAIPKETAQ